MSDRIDPPLVSHQLTGVMDGSVHCLRCGWSGWPDEIPEQCPPQREPDKSGGPPFDSDEPIIQVVGDGTTTLADLNDMGPSRICPPAPALDLGRFEVAWADDGLLLHCRRCGVHHWRPVWERMLSELIEQAEAHLKVCNPDEPQRLGAP